MRICYLVSSKPSTDFFEHSDHQLLLFETMQCILNPIAANIHKIPGLGLLKKSAERLQASSQLKQRSKTEFPL